MLVAIPIALAASYLLFASFASSAGYQVNVSSYYSSRLDQYTVSQELASAIDLGAISYSQASTLLKSESALMHLNISIEPLRAENSCTRASICRIVEVEGNSYILVVENEKPN